MKWQERGLVLDTKISPRAPLAAIAQGYSHKPEDLRRALTDSLKALKTDKVCSDPIHASLARSLTVAQIDIIIGASSSGQLEQNLTSLNGGPLPEEMVRAFDEAWTVVKAVAKPYFR